MNILECAGNDRSVDSTKIGKAIGVRKAFLRMDIIATGCLFKEIFSITGPLNKYLQSVQMEFALATN